MPSSTSLATQVLRDLQEETNHLDVMVSSFDSDAWSAVTTQDGSTVRDQLGHLAWTDRVALAAIEDPEVFGWVRQLSEALADLADSEAARYARLGSELLQVWREGARKLQASLDAAPASFRIPWFGPPMSITSMATARFMETWAHGHDIAESMGVTVPRHDRVRHVCHLGVMTFGFAHSNRGEAVPEAIPRVELVSPSSEIWVWGPEDSENRVTGDAWEFALLATRRRHRDDVAIDATGTVADHWLDIIQAFAGQPGNDPVRKSYR